MKSRENHNNLLIADISPALDIDHNIVVFYNTHMLKLDFLGDLKDCNSRRREMRVIKDDYQPANAANTGKSARVSMIDFSCEMGWWNGMYN